MIELKCKKCNGNEKKCDSDVVAFTCSECSMIDLIINCEKQIMGIA